MSSRPSSPGTPPAKIAGSIQVAPGHSMPPTPEPSGAETTSNSRQG